MIIRTIPSPCFYFSMNNLVAISHHGSEGMGWGESKTQNIFPIVFEGEDIDELK